MSKRKPIPLLDDHIMKRFFKYVKKTDDCWLWTGTRMGFKKDYDNEYGKFTINSMPYNAHRIAWNWFNPDDKLENEDALHTCDNPPCVNPAHLFKGIQSDNNKDRDTKGRQNGPRKEAVHCAILTEEAIQYIRENYVNLGNQKHANSAVALGEKFGVTKQAVLRVLWGKSWKDVK